MQMMRSCAEPSMYARMFVPTWRNNIRPPPRTLVLNYAMHVPILHGQVRHLFANRLNTLIPLRRVMDVCSEHPSEPGRVVARPCCVWSRDHPWPVPQNPNVKLLKLINLAPGRCGSIWTFYSRITYAYIHGLGHHWFGLWIVALSVPNHHLYQCYVLPISLSRTPLVDLIRNSSSHRRTCIQNVACKTAEFIFCFSQRVAA